MKKQYYFYILRCSDNSYYTGTTTDLNTREESHNAGRGANYTRIRRPVHLVYHETFDVFEDAVRRERQVKRWSRAKKEALIKGNIGKLKKLSKSEQ